MVNKEHTLEYHAARIEKVGIEKFEQEIDTYTPLAKEAAQKAINNYYKNLDHTRIETRDGIARRTLNWTALGVLVGIAILALTVREYFS